MKKNVEIIKSGFWLYDNQIKMPVYIIKQNWDYYYEENYTDEAPHLNDDGFAYYVVGGKKNNDIYDSRSETFYTIEEAIVYANNNYNNLKWE